MSIRRVTRCEAHIATECWITWRWLEETGSWVFDHAETEGNE